jgi:hypothetical protein
VTQMFPQFFGVPQEIIRNGLFARMKPGEVNLYVYLAHESERYSSRRIKRTDAQITEGAGVASRTLCNARKKLQEYGLIQVAKADGNKYIYTFCDPMTGLPYSGDPKTPVRYQKKSNVSVSVAHAASAPSQLEVHGIPASAIFRD